MVKNFGSKIGNMAEQYFKRWNSSQIFYGGLALFGLLNLLTAAFMEIHFDEGYYWLYAQNPAFGYFDHPPLIAWMIRAGQFLFPGELGLRLFTVLMSTASMLFLWKIARNFTQNALLFWGVAFSTLLIHPYAFIATPDAPLFFSTVLFFYVFDRYLKTGSNSLGIALGTTIALMFYSKYHGVLVVGFATLANLKLLGKRSYWLAALTALVLFMPHIWWQISHNFPTLQYHLIDSHKTGYNPEVTLNYIVSELAVTGPWLGWLFLYAMAKVKAQTPFVRTLKIMGIGTFVFFLISTFGGDFEAHWTLIAFVPLILLAIEYVEQNPKWKRWVYISAGVNFMLLLIVRILIISPLSNDIKALGIIKGWKNDSYELKAQTENLPIVFQDSWNRAARFAYYTNDPMVTNLNSGLYRRNQFDLYDTDEKLTGQTVYVISNDSTQFSSFRTIKTSKATWYAYKMENFRSYYNLKFELTKPIEISNNQVRATVSIQNTYNEAIALPNTQFNLNHKGKRKWEEVASFPADTIKLEAGERYQNEVTFNISEDQLVSQEIYLTLRVGELNPIPGRFAIDMKKQSK